MFQILMIMSIAALEIGSAVLQTYDEEYDPYTYEPDPLYMPKNFFNILVSSHIVCQNPCPRGERHAEGCRCQKILMRPTSFKGFHHIGVAARCPHNSCPRGQKPDHHCNCKDVVTRPVLYRHNSNDGRTIVIGSAICGGKTCPEGSRLTTTCHCKNVVTRSPVYRRKYYNYNYN